jgi:hypothetical protein
MQNYIKVRPMLKLCSVPVGCGSGIGEMLCCLVVGGHRSMCWLYLSKHVALYRIDIFTCVLC